MTITKAPTGTASYRDGVLTITTQVKRGKKLVPNKSTYRVGDLRLVLGVPALLLTKFDASGDIKQYTVTFSPEFGLSCSCEHYQFRGQHSDVPCKHARAAQVVGLIPKKVNNEPSNTRPTATAASSPANPGEAG